jgi:NAD-dependent SIR2 family protein deacetylase
MNKWARLQLKSLGITPICQNCLTEFPKAYEFHNGQILYCDQCRDCLKVDKTFIEKFYQEENSLEGYLQTSDTLL